MKKHEYSVTIAEYELPWLDYKFYEDILIKAINKAIKNGYNYEFYIRQLDKWVVTKFTSHRPVVNDGVMLYSEYKEKGKTYYESSFTKTKILIFDHDFAKALWGKEWKNHLQMMILEKNPIKYLEKNI